MFLAVQIYMVLKVELVDTELQVEEEVRDFILFQQQYVLGELVQVANIIINQMTEPRLVGDTLNEVDQDAIDLADGLAAK